MSRRIKIKNQPQTKTADTIQQPTNNPATKPPQPATIPDIIKIIFPYLSHKPDCAFLRKKSASGIPAPCNCGLAELFDL